MPEESLLYCGIKKHDAWHDTYCDNIFFHLILVQLTMSIKSGYFDYPLVDVC